MIKLLKDRGVFVWENLGPTWIYLFQRMDLGFSWHLYLPLTFIIFFWLKAIISSTTRLFALWELIGVMVLTLFAEHRLAAFWALAGEELRFLFFLISFYFRGSSRFKSSEGGIDFIFSSKACAFATMGTSFRPFFMVVIFCKRKLSKKDTQNEE